MALFKFRKGRDEQPATKASKAPKAPTVEVVRRRAMHRLIGAAVLVLAGVIGFPLIFDNQPRPISVDLPIEIVDPSKVKPLVLPSAPPSSGVVVAAPAAPVTPEQPLAQQQQQKPPPAAAPAAPVATPPVDTAAVTPEKPKTPAVTEENPEVRSLDAKKARALLEARPLPADVAPAKPSAAAAAKPPAVAGANAAASDDRFVVQIGAFADASKVRDVRRKVEAAGLKTYTQVVSTSEGDRTRVRVGPFSDRAEADKAAAKIRQLKLAAAILTL